ncbi:hypothetical protein PVAG01_01919 [Phlyctema vagabunda]|uniref:Uncharacterized protein n=1 Tax=Phlyctema vagabunda TaxID=108571 RepID=A0ABR4PYF2_9HELO
MQFTRFASGALFLSLNLINSVAGDAIATFLPCEGCPSNVKPQPITVTEQYQAVSTCIPTTVCKPTTASICTLKSASSQSSQSCSTHTGTTCSAEYPFTTYAFVSTVIPCAGKESKTTVTKTEQPVTVGYVSTTSTSYTTYTSYPSASVNGTYLNSTSPITHVDIVSIDVIVIDYVSPYNQIGEIGIWGYGGSGLCKECGPFKDGSVQQVVDVHSCIGAKCVDFKETWYRGPTVTEVTATQTLTATYAAQTDGVHTITLCPAAVAATTSVPHVTTITIPGTTTVCPGNGVYTVTVKEPVVTVVIADHPTTISSGAKTTVCPSAGIYTWTVEPEICHTTTVTEGPTTLYYPATTTSCSAGVHTLTVAPVVATTTSIAHCPTTVTITKTITSTFVVGCPATPHPVTSTSSTAPQSQSATTTVATTTSASSTETASSTSSIPTADPSSDPDLDLEVAQPTKRAAVLQPKFGDSKVIRRGGLLRSPRHPEQAAQPIKKTRDFSVKMKKRALLH